MGEVHNIKIYKKKRQNLRNNATKAEKLLWQKLKNSQLGYKFRRQHGIKQYVVDFYCPKLKLIVELDGDVHNFIEQQKHDWIKEKNLEKLGFKIIRYHNNEIIKDIDKVMVNIKAICKKLE
jgi:very-short-patch-repair endonuclease